ncbi:MAG TPA: hypothetical protein VGG44_03515 [Tepidisphaeraceae bacterium]
MASQVKVERVAYRNFANAVRISNGSVEAIVVPSIGGRLMRFAVIGGDNVLWENPTVPVSQAGKTGNWGGEKSWPWPQDDWTDRTGQGWPPPPASDQYSYQCEIEPDGVRLTSQNLDGYDVQIVREFKMSPATNELIENISFAAAGAGAGKAPAGVWSIAEVPVTKNIFVRQTAATFRQLGFSPWPAPGKAAGGILVLDRPADNKSKIGLDADLLAVAIRNQLLSIECRDVSPPAAGYVTGERAQLYTEPDSSPDVAGLGGFTELEFTSPVGTVGTQPVRMNMVWKLEPLATSDPAAIAQRLSSRPK